MNIVMPRLGESVEEGTVIRWLKKVGDPIERDESVVEITTDKIDTDIPAIAGGVLSEIRVAEGTTVAIGEVIGVIDTGDDDADGPGGPGGPGETEAAEQAGDSGGEVETIEADELTQAAEAGDGGPLKRRRSERFYSPLVLRIAREERIDMATLESLEGTGKGGRLTRDDLLSYLERRASRIPEAAAEQEDESEFVSVSRPAGTEEARVVNLDTLRKTIAKHMVLSKQVSPHVTSVSEVDMTHVVRYRDEARERFQQKTGIRLTLTPFFITAIVDALRANPMLNATMDGDRVLQWKHVNMGLAVGLEKGVVVPVIRHADEMDFSEIAAAAHDLAKRAHDRKLTPDDLQGSTFTLTNPGMWATLFGTPIINQPEAGIIATGSVKKQVVVQADDSLAIRSMMFLSLSFDHRFIDGLNAARFIRDITQNLESFDTDRVGV
ncbi:MAG: 2-oxo acid dehydrogenase subunit E2 [Gemmatimonadetes bacterium]|nr:2-oxo acid dehydrogenase subunit E2 [Gemmatimonadota bacterium]MYD25552.1 2-oxo acid dehydrogenase subunit E2 [Gemmatimonadota bacterium]